MDIDSSRSAAIPLQPTGGAGHLGLLARVVKVSDRSSFKILSFKQMLQKLTKVLARVKAGNTPGHLLNEFRQIIYSLHRPKEITKKVCNNIINSIQI